MGNVSNAAKIFAAMKANPKAGWRPENVKTVCYAHDIKIRQSGTSHAVLTNREGTHLTIPMHKPIKSIYIKKFIALVEGDGQ